MENMIKIKNSWQFTPNGSSLAAFHPSIKDYTPPTKRGRIEGKFRVREKDGCLEELYWLKNVAVLSRQDVDGWKVVQTYSRQTKIRECLWCVFEADSKIIEWLAIIEERTGTFVAESGNSVFLEVNFPFPVRSAFSMKPDVGIILNSITISNSNTPTVFQMKHPLDDILPIWCEFNHEFLPITGRVVYAATINGSAILLNYKDDYKLFVLTKATSKEEETLKTQFDADGIHQSGHSPDKSQKNEKSTIASKLYMTPTRLTPSKFTPRKTPFRHSIIRTPRNRVHSVSHPATPNQSVFISRNCSNFTFSERTSQYAAGSDAQPRSLWPSKIGRRLHTEKPLNLDHKTTIDYHKNIFDETFLLITSNNCLTLIELDQLDQKKMLKIHVIKDVSSVASLNGFFVTLSETDFTFLFTGTKQVAQINCLEPNKTPVEKVLSLEAVSTPRMSRDRLFSTPNIQPSQKRKSMLVKTNLSPVAPNLPDSPAFVSPDYKRSVLSHSVNNSFCLKKKKTYRIEIDIDYFSNKLLSKFWRLLKVILEKSVFINFVSDWLVQKSSKKHSFNDFIHFLLDHFGVILQSTENDINDIKRTKNEDDFDYDKNAALWSSEYLATLSLKSPKQSALELDSKQLLPTSAVFRLLFVMYEDLSFSLYYEKECNYLKKILIQLTALLNLKSFESYFNNKDCFSLTSDIPSISRTISAILKKRTEIKMRKLAFHYEINSRTCLLLNLYLNAFYNMSPGEIRQTITQKMKEHILIEKKEYFSLPTEQVINYDGILQLLSYISVNEWEDLPSFVKLPIRNLAKDTISLNSVALKIGPVDNIRNILGAENEQQCSNDQKYQWITTHSNDGLICLAGDSYIKNIFPEDLRSVTARNLLKTSIPVSSAAIGLTKEMVNTTTQFMVEERFLEISKRTIAKMFGRALAAYSTATINPIVEKFMVPKVDLSLALEQGLIQAGLFTPDLANANTLSRMEIADAWCDWPYYHNAVAGGLSLCENLPLNSTWILWNKPSQPENGGIAAKVRALVAGALLGIGLRGYVDLEPYHTIIQFTHDRYPLALVSLFLGLCASHVYAGSGNTMLTSLLTIHLPFLINKNENLLQTKLMTQTAAVLALGFLHRNRPNKQQESNISRYADLLLNEICKNPDPDRDSPNGREAYSTAAGMSVGLLLLGAGNDKSLSSLNIINRLKTLINGGENRIPEASYVMENNLINPWIVKTGAMAATALIFLGTNDMEVASWFEIPKSAKLIEGIKPTDLTMMTITRFMVALDHIEPTMEWIDSIKPPIVRQYPLSERSVYNWVNHQRYARSIEKIVNEATDCTVTATADLSIDVGAVFVLALKYAGTHDTLVTNVIRLIFYKIHRFIQIKPRENFISSGFLQQSIGTVLLSWAMVVSGSGDVEVLRHCRHYSIAEATLVNYGMELAVHQAIGILFLGGAQYSFINDLVSISTLFICLLPKYPASPNDNFQILQAQRHLACLCARKRLLVPTNRVNETVVSKALLGLKNGQTIAKTLPGVIPTNVEFVRLGVDSTNSKDNTCLDGAMVEDILLNKNGRIIIQAELENCDINCISEQADFHDTSELRHILHVTKYNGEEVKNVEYYHQLYGDQLNCNLEKDLVDLDQNLMSTLNVNNDKPQSIEELADLFCPE